MPTRADRGRLSSTRLVERVVERGVTDAFQLFDAEWRFVYQNPVARQYFARHGLDPDSVIGKRFWDDIFPEVRDGEAARQMRRAMEERVPVAFENYHGPWDSWQLSRFEPLPDGGVANYFQDISESKRRHERLGRHKRHVAADLAGMARLQEVSTRLVTAADDSSALLLEIVDAAITVTAADMGNIQLFDRESGTLKIVASRGFDRDFLEFFDSVAEDQAACGAALHRGERVAIDDVTTSPLFVGTPSFDAVVAAGIRGMQSTPLIVRSGRLVGMLSTHYRAPRSPAVRDLHVLDLLARQAADWIERTQDEETLRRTEERFRRYFELGLVGMAITSPTMGCLAVNDRACSILGYSREELLEKTWDEITHPSDLAADLAEFERVIAGETDGYSIDKRWIRKDGRVVDSEISVSCVRRPDRSVDYFVALVDDVTERRRADRALRTSEKRYRGLISQVRDYAIFSTDERGLISSWNEGCREVLGYTEDEFIGLSIEALFTPDDRAGAVPRARLRLAADTGSARIDGWMMTSRGNRFFAMGGFTALIDRAWGCIGFSVILRDVTQMRMSHEESEHRGERLARLVSERTDALEEATKRLRMSERMASLGTLAAGLGHDLGNLLLPLDVRLQILKRADLQPELNAQIAGITSCVRYLQRLTRGLTLLAVDPTEGPFPEPTELRAWWGDVSMLLKNVLPRGITFEGQMPSSETWVSIGRIGLTQAVFNAVQNAADALVGRTRGLVSVTVEYGVEPGMVAIRIADDGPGMTDEVRRHCTEPYFSTKARGISTGMGLALVHGLVTSSGGHVVIGSTLGLGTSVRLVLPGAHLPDRSSKVAPPVAIVRIKDARVRSFVSGELRTLGFTARTRRAREEPDVIVVDTARETSGASSARKRAVTIPLGPDPDPEAIRQALRSAAAAIAIVGAAAIPPPP